MKKQQSIIGKFAVLLLLFSVHLSASSKSLPSNEALEETVRLKLNELIGNKNYSFESLNAHESGKGLKGIGTFFSKKNVGFTIYYDTLSQNASFELDLPSNAKIGLNKNDVKSLTGASFKNMIPKALRKGLSLRNFNFKFNKERKEISEVDLTFDFLKNWELLRFNKFSLNNIKVVLNIKYPKEGEKKASSAILEGLTSIAGKPVLFSANLKEDQKSIEYVATVKDINFKSSLISLVGDASLGGISIPEKLFDIKLPSTQLTVKPGAKSILFNSVATFGVVDGYINKVEKPKRGNKNYSYLLTIAPHKDAKLSKISDKLKILDKIDLSKQLIVLSSEAKSKEEKDKTPFKDKIGAGVKKGLNMVANFDLTKIKLDHLIGVKNLVVSSPIGAKLDQIVLESSLDTNVEIGPTATLSNVIFRLKPSPKDFSISLLGEMSTKIGTDDLIFQGGVEVVLTDQTLNFLAMMKGQWNDPLGAKGLSVKDVGIQLGASFTTTPIPLPNIALSGEVFIGSFKGGATVAIDTRNPSKSMLSMNYNKISLWDLIDLVTSPSIKSKINPKFKNTLRNFYSENVLMEVVPVSMQVFDKYYEAGFRMNGGISLGGLKGEAGFDIDYTNGITAYGAVDPIKVAFFEFKGANGKPRPSFSLSLEKNKTPTIIANGGVKLLGIETSADVHLMDNGYNFMVNGKVFNLYQATIKAKGTNLKKAENMELDVALKNDFSGIVERELKNFVAAKTSKAVQKLRTAKSNVAKAEKKVNESDRHVANVRRIVIADQAKDRAKIQNARNKVNAAQAKVNQLTAKINALTRQRDALKKFSPKRVPLNTKIAATKTARFTATKTLNGAKHVLNGLTKLNIDPNKDGRLISAKALQKTAKSTLKGAQHALNGLIWTLGKTGEVGSFIIEKGSDAAVKVKKAGFKGALGKVNGAKVDLNLELDWLNKRRSLNVKVDLRNMKNEILNIGKTLLEK